MTTEGLIYFYGLIFALASAVFKTQKMFTLHGGFLAIIHCHKEMIESNLTFDSRCAVDI